MIIRDIRATNFSESLLWGAIWAIFGQKGVGEGPKPRFFDLVSSGMVKNGVLKKKELPKTRNWRDVVLPRAF